MTTPTKTVQVAAVVPEDLAKSLRQLAQKSERSTAAEIRLALKTWVDTRPSEEAA